MPDLSCPLTPRRRLAYLLPVFNESQTIDALHDPLSRTAASLGTHYEVEFVYVDDGSTDGSLPALLALREHDPRVTVIGLSRNYGTGLHRGSNPSALDDPARE